VHKLIRKILAIVEVKQITTHKNGQNGRNREAIRASNPYSLKGTKPFNFYEVSKHNNASPRQLLGSHWNHSGILSDNKIDKYISDGSFAAKPNYIDCSSLCISAPPLYVTEKVMRLCNYYIRNMLSLQRFLLFHVSETTNMINNHKIATIIPKHMLTTMPFCLLACQSNLMQLFLIRAR
jgi:hypothetical protein